MKLRRTLPLGLVLLCFVAPALTAGTPGPYSVPTDFLVLVGFPASDQTRSSVPYIVPGAVIPLDAEPAGRPVQEALDKTLSHARVVEKLWATFRLDAGRRMQKSASSAVMMGKEFELPRIDQATIAITAMLVGYNEKGATYRIRFMQGEKKLADSTINVNFGGRAVVGGMDGSTAPYIFVIVEPGTPGREVITDITHPAVVSQVLPQYPESAVKEKITGVVVLELMVDTEGKPSDLKVLESPDPRLTEAAVAAVKQWKFAPARKPDGTPVTVRSTLSLNFRLK